MSEEIRIANWLPELKRYAKGFYEEMCSRNENFKDIVEYDESKFEKIFEKYKVYRDDLHSIIKGKFIDRHKILAAIMLAATDKENLIFKVDNEAISRSSIADFPYWLIFPNEYYLSTALVRILTDCVLGTNKSKIHNLTDKNYDIRFPDKIVWWKEDITQPYAEQFSQLLSMLIMIDNSAVKRSLLASHLIFFFELAYDCAVQELKEIYYTSNGG